MARSRWRGVVRMALSDCLFRPAAEIVDQANLAARLARQAGIAAMQDQPMMRVQHELGRNYFLKPEFDLERRLARRKPGTIGDAKYMGIDSDGAVAIGHIEHDVGGLPPCARQRLDLRTGARHLAAELVDQLLRECDDVLRLGAIESDGLDVVAKLLLAEREHFLWRIGDRKQRARRLVDAGIRGL